MVRHGRKRSGALFHTDAGAPLCQWPGESKEAESPFSRDQEWTDPKSVTLTTPKILAAIIVIPRRQLLIVYTTLFSRLIFSQEKKEVQWNFDIPTNIGIAIGTRTLGRDTIAGMQGSTGVVVVGEQPVVVQQPNQCWHRYVHTLGGYTSGS